MSSNSCPHYVHILSHYDCTAEHEKEVGALFEKDIYGILAVGDNIHKAIDDEGAKAAWVKHKSQVVEELEAGKERPTWNTTCVSARKSE